MPSTPPDRWPWLSDDIKGESDAARIAAQAEANNLAEALRVAEAERDAARQWARAWKTSAKTWRGMADDFGKLIVDNDDLSIDPIRLQAVIDAFTRTGEAARAEKCEAERALSQ